MSEPRVRRIAIDCRMWEASGIGTYLQNLAPRVIRRMPATKFALLGNAPSLADLRTDNVSVRPLAAPIYSVQEQWAVPRAVPEGTELLWTPHYNLPLFSPCPVVVTIHDILHLAMPELFPGWPKQLYAAVMFRAAMRKAGAILTVSRFTAEELSRLLGRWVVRERIHIVPNGVDESWFDILSGPRPQEREYLLYVGNVKPHKNLRRLTEAFALIKDSMAVDLVIVGEREGFLTGDAELAAATNHLGDRVHFTGRVALAELRQYYRHACALVLPSLYEGFGLTALEAMAAGCPVAVSRAASLPEVCGDAALYFDPADTADLAAALRRMIGDNRLRGELTFKGKQRAREFSWERAADQTVEVIRNVMQRRDEP